MVMGTMKVKKKAKYGDANDFCSVHVFGNGDPVKHNATEGTDKHK